MTEKRYRLEEYVETLDGEFSSMKEFLSGSESEWRLKSSKEVVIFNLKQPTKEFDIDPDKVYLMIKNGIHILDHIFKNLTVQ